MHFLMVKRVTDNSTLMLIVLSNLYGIIYVVSDLIMRWSHALSL
jgi:hypothetical protein